MYEFQMDQNQCLQMSTARGVRHQNGYRSVREEICLAYRDVSFRKIEENVIGRDDRLMVGKILCAQLAMVMVKEQCGACYNWHSGCFLITFSFLQDFIHFGFLMNTFFPFQFFFQLLLFMAMMMMMLNVKSSVRERWVGHL